MKARHPEAPRCDCEPVAACAIVARHPVASAWAREQAYELVDRTLKWDGYPMIRATQVTIAELTPECWLLQDEVVLADSRVYVWRPESIGALGGAGYGLSRIEGVTARSFEPIGQGFIRDAEHVQSWWDGVVVGADRASFEVLDCPESNRPWFRARDRYGCFVEDDGGHVVRAASRGSQPPPVE